MSDAERRDLEYAMVMWPDGRLVERPAALLRDRDAFARALVEARAAGYDVTNLCWNSVRGWHPKPRPWTWDERRQRWMPPVLSRQEAELRHAELGGELAAEVRALAPPRPDDYAFLRDMRRA